MKKILVVATILSVIAVTLRMAASVSQIEKMIKRWYKADFEMNNKPSINLNLRGGVNNEEKYGRNYWSFIERNSRR